MQGNDVSRHLKMLRSGLHEHVEFIAELRAQYSDFDAQRPVYRSWMLESAVKMGVSEAQFNQYVSEGLLNMNLTGIGRYLDLRSEHAKFG